VVAVRWRRWFLALLVLAQALLALASDEVKGLG